MADLEPARKIDRASPGAALDDGTPVTSSSSIAPSLVPRGPSLVSRIAAIVTAPIPGVGHVLLGRLAKGSIYFMLFFATLDAAFLNALLDDRGDLQRYGYVLLAVGAMIWLLAFTDLFITLVILRPLAADERSSRFLAGVSHYLRNELPEAKSLFLRLLARNPTDTPAAILLAHVYRHQGRLGKARRLLRRHHRLDRQRVWEYELLAEQRRLENLKRARG